MTTNREKLAKMTNEELAELLEHNFDCNNCPVQYKKCVHIQKKCKEIILQWLEQESEEE